MWWWKVAGDSPGPERNCGERVGVRKSEDELVPVRDDEARISSCMERTEEADDMGGEVQLL